MMTMQQQTARPGSSSWRGEATGCPGVSNPPLQVRGSHHSHQSHPLTHPRTRARTPPTRRGPGDQLPPFAAGCSLLPPKPPPPKVHTSPAAVTAALMKRPAESCRGRQQTGHGTAEGEQWRCGRMVSPLLACRCPSDSPARRKAVTNHPSRQAASLRLTQGGWHPPAPTCTHQHPPARCVLHPAPPARAAWERIFPGGRGPGAPGWQSDRA